MNPVAKIQADTGFSWSDILLVFLKDSTALDEFCVTNEGKGYKDRAKDVADSFAKLSCVGVKERLTQEGITGIKVDHSFLD